MREGGGAEAPCQEKAVAVLSQFIMDSLNNNLVSEHQHCDGRGKEEVFQDAALRTAHELYSSSHFTSLGGKFSMSLQEDIQQTTINRYHGRHNEEGGRDEEDEAGGGRCGGGHGGEDLMAAKTTTAGKMGANTAEAEAVMAMADVTAETEDATEDVTVSKDASEESV
jgi:hypothetical protein